VQNSDAFLFAPQLATRVKRSVHTDTPFPPEEPAGQNPPDGAIVHYFLKAAPARPVVLEVLDGAGTVVRRYRSDDVAEPPVEGRNIPDYWIRPPQVLSAQPGLHRFVWDLHHAPPAAPSFSYPIAAIAFDTPREPRGPWVVPGAYRVQIVAANSQEAADEMLDRAKQAGFKGLIVREGAFYKVRLGEYATRSEATAAAAKVKAKLGGSPFVVAP